ncbi:MAG: IS66 family insertion sequence element accessory protein TnpB [Lachnospiraceae bacterium]|nr:IS66 family insertion sequence element accessory protein TnpB [Lachnospiraceae bacterium]
METRRHTRTKDEWMELITQCRQSGLSDHQWCVQQGIPDSTLYNAIARLRKKSYELPERVPANPEIDLTSRQDVVEIDIVRDPVPERTMPAIQADEQHFEKSHMIEITIGHARINIPSQADPKWLAAAVREIGRMTC